METTHRLHRLKTLLAFAITYFAWGSTLLAIRVGVHEVPPALGSGSPLPGLCSTYGCVPGVLLRPLSASGHRLRCWRC
jgi:hypothetical protein